METQKIWNEYKNELYFFILKRVKSKTLTNDVFQNTFVKIHANLPKLKDEKKVKAWIFQIARNEIIDHHKQENVFVERLKESSTDDFQDFQEVCCFDKFIDELPEIYKQVIELTYIKGQKQKETAKELEISLENVKARIKRAKEMLTQRFNECCKYKYNKNGKLVGEANCAACQD
ncbi:RNA polymerase subunit sigma-70 [Brumimicrobium salinarum]|uniref:RNA polymerase subunit sigma-70 n=1 Tax=Brumimicrobium salinarum TaxID=2058658 RepID=A0A2I0R4A5_9FLAO|nr:sigma-70 family RNA polymerase sigma factor [Brumimicrobium salinarum]PKR81413.1 RNA polymerase subunit sigma-70 [Brumimicrobium salinarum]